MLVASVMASGCANRSLIHKAPARNPDYSYFEPEMSEFPDKPGYGLIKGVIRDRTRALPLGTVVLRPLSNPQRERSIQANEKGEFEFVVKKAGAYSVEFFYARFRPAFCPQVDMKDGSVAYIRAELEPFSEDAKEIEASPSPSVGKIAEAGGDK